MVLACPSRIQNYGRVNIGITNESDGSSKYWATCATGDVLSGPVYGNDVPVVGFRASTYGDPLETNFKLGKRDDGI